MKLLSKILRKQLNLLQIAGFFLANVIGMSIILLAVQLYSDIRPIYQSPDSFLKNDYIILSKRVNNLQLAGLGSSTFTPNEIKELEDQKFVRSTGLFTTANYNITGSFSAVGTTMSTYMFFESVPDNFLDVESEMWRFEPDSKIIPIIIPKNYLNLYNYGFAQSQGLPQVSQDLFSLLKIRIEISGNGRYETFTGRIAGFSNRLNTILVPQNFMEWSNSVFSDTKPTGPSRIIAEVSSLSDDNMHKFISSHGYEIEGDSNDGGKSSYFVKLMAFIVMAIGVIICFLSVAMLMLSIFLLLQKNTDKLRNLLLLGLTPAKVSSPYRRLVIWLNAGVALLSFIVVMVLRHLYLPHLSSLAIEYKAGSIVPSIVAAIIIFTTVALLNSIAVHRKVMSLWRA